MILSHDSDEGARLVAGDDAHVMVGRFSNKPRVRAGQQPPSAGACCDRPGVGVMDGFFKRGWLLVLSLVAVKAFLVAPALNARSLYRDDAWQALAVRVETLHEVVESGATAPGFGLLLRLWSGIAGDSTFALQLPAFLAGIAGPPLCYLAARRFGMKRTSAWIAGLLMCLATLHSEQSARVKPYTFDVVAAIVMLLVAKGVCDDTSRTSRFVLLVGLAAVAFFVSSTAGIAGASLVGFCGVWLLCGAVGRTTTGGYRVDWQVAGKAIAGLLVFGLLAGGWTLFALGVRKNDALREFWAPKLVDVDEGIAVAAKKLIVGGGKSAASLACMPDQLPRELTAAPVVGMIAVGCVIGFRLLPWRHWCLLIATPMAALVLAAAGAIPLGGGRTDLYLAPFYALMAAQSVDALLRWGTPRAIAAVQLAGLAVVAFGLLYGRVAYPVEDLRRLTTTVMSRVGPSDKIVIIPQVSYMVAFYSGMSVRLVPDSLAMTGFTPAVDDDRVVSLPGFEFNGYGPVYRQGVRRCVATMREVLATQPARVWLVDSLLFDDRLPELNDVLEDRGYVCVETVCAENASATVWQAAPSGDAGGRPPQR